MTIYQIPSVSNQAINRPSDVTPRVAPELPLPKLGIYDENLPQMRRFLNPEGYRRLWGWAPPDHPAGLAIIVVLGLIAYLAFVHRGKR